MFVYVEDLADNRTRLLNTDHIIECVDYADEEFWEIHLTNNRSMSVHNDDFFAMTSSLEGLIAK